MALVGRWRAPNHPRTPSFSSRGIFGLRQWKALIPYATRPAPSAPPRLLFPEVNDPPLLRDTYAGDGEGAEGAEVSGAH